MVTSVEFNLIRCATMLCHFGQTLSSYVAILFILRGRTATSSATIDYIAVPERFGRNEEPAGGNEEQTRKKPGFFPKADVIDAITTQTCNHDFFNFLCSLFFLKLMNSIIFSFGGKSFNFLFILSFMMPARENEL